MAKKHIYKTETPNLQQIISGWLEILGDQTKSVQEKLLAIAEICKLEAYSVLNDFFYEETDLRKKVLISTAMLAYDGYQRAAEFLKTNANNASVSVLVAEMLQLIPGYEDKPKSNSRYKQSPKKLGHNLAFIKKIWDLAYPENAAKNAISDRAKELLRSMGITKAEQKFYHFGKEIN